jgi:hypothetical protein
MNFNRPTMVYFWVRATVDLYDEEIFPDSGALQLQTVIADTGNDFGIGKDVIIQRFYGPVYANISGIGKLDLSVAYSYDPDVPPADAAFVTTNIPIAARELSQFSSSRVQITITPPTRKAIR